MTINQVKNPETKGGTGNFMIASKKGENLLDENRVFGVIGIADSPSIIYNAYIEIANNNSRFVSMQASYKVSFQSNQDLPDKFFIQMEAPISSGFSIVENQDCGLYTVNNVNYTCICETMKNLIILRGNIFQMSILDLFH